MGNLFDLIAGLNKPAAERPALHLVEIPTPEAAADAPPAPAAEAASEPQHFIRTAATASPAWLAVRDQFHSHIFGDCPCCHPPTGRYCPTGAELRATYDTTPMELTP
ncbi:hypothetical protein SAMN05216229_106119 [Geopseudomonas sagittaria]|uniref:Uncharacterized protein n=1 Tax=Geopseudomonas sagittaria TaxID=1135990 RepID=A0A1I5THD8_9GAMM|nr:hypothetical protein [Pseudomonas sagittaria]SFP82484.1 hypothetical protein SAMN05216229_106119 [Pseudomonas sagittaria]